jgi:hypothetical protein
MLFGMPRPVANPPNPWASTRIEWLDEEPPPDAVRAMEFEALRPGVPSDEDRRPVTDEELP